MMSSLDENLANFDPEKYVGLAVELTRRAVGKCEGFRDRDGKNFLKAKK